jgi:hypothetical protein
MYYFELKHVGLHYSSTYCDFIKLDLSECSSSVYFIIFKRQKFSTVTILNTVA